MEYEAIKTYTFKWDRNLKIMDMDDGDDDNDVDAAGEEVDRRARKYMSEYVCDDYGVALQTILAANPDLKSRYADMAEPTLQRNFAQAEVEDAGMEVDRRAKEYIVERGGSYVEAVDVVLASDENLAELYGSIGW